MNYDQEITKLVEAIKADKAIVQPWRNKAVARLEETQAFVRMGKTSTSVSVLDKGGEAVSSTSGCTCPMYPHAIDATCLVHGAR